MRVCCTGWHVCAAAAWLLAAAASAQDAEETPPAEPAVEEAPEPPPEVEPPASDAAPAEDSVTDELAAPGAEATPPDEFSGLEEASPPATARPGTGTRARPENTLESAEAPPPRFWRMPREGTRRPQTLPQGVMYFRSIVSGAAVPAGTGSQGRGSGYFGYAVGVFDDLEIGTWPVAVTFLPPISFADPSFFLRARLVSGEVQFSLRGEWTIPLSSNGGAWMGYSAELAWTPVEWFRFETALEYGLHFLTPLQQTVYVPLRAMFQAGPNTFGVTTGAVMYNDADDFDVPLIFRYAVAFGGWQGPLSEPAIEGGIGDLTQASQSWFIRGVWTFYAYP